MKPHFLGSDSNRTRCVLCLADSSSGHRDFRREGFGDKVQSLHVMPLPY